ncbi:MAG: glycosyltransferase [Desulfobacteraceae bacterium]|nr:MAG: glycosyltransferase [Desulfobacteraceae bacterium]
MCCSRDDTPKQAHYRFALDTSSTSELVSIIIPTFNQGKYLPACVDHCLFQTYSNLEIIIVDGGSTDSTKEYLAGVEGEVSERLVQPVSGMDAKGEIVREEHRAYPQNRHLKILRFQEDVGPTRTINEGLSRATGEYCTYVVGDDLPHPHMIEELASALDLTGADFAYSDMNVVEDTGRIVRQMRLPDYSFDECLAKWYHMGVSRLYRTIWHLKVGLMDEQFQGANDYDHYLRFAMAGAIFHHVPKILYSVRHHGKERQTGQHTSERYENLLSESRRCAYRAREFLSSTRRDRQDPGCQAAVDSASGEPRDCHEKGASFS